MKNLEISENNHINYCFAVFELQNLLEIGFKEYDFSLNPIRNVNNYLHNENEHNDGFLALQYLLTSKSGSKNFLELHKSIRDFFGFNMPITIIWEHVWNKDKFSLKFKTAFFIGKNGFLHIFKSLPKLASRISKIIKSNANANL